MEKTYTYSATKTSRVTRSGHHRQFQLIVDGALPLAAAEAIATSHGAPAGERGYDLADLKHVFTWIVAS